MSLPRNAADVVVDAFESVIGVTHPKRHHRYDCKDEQVGSLLAASVAPQGVTSDDFMLDAIEGIANELATICAAVENDVNYKIVGSALSCAEGRLRVILEIYRRGMNAVRAEAERDRAGERNAEAAQ